MVDKSASSWLYTMPCHLKAAYENICIISWLLVLLLGLYVHIIISCGYIFVAPCNASYFYRDDSGSVARIGWDSGSALQPGGKSTARSVFSHLFSLFQLRFC